MNFELLDYNLNLIKMGHGIGDISLNYVAVRILDGAWLKIISTHDVL